MRRTKLGCLAAAVVGLVVSSTHATTTEVVNYGFNDSLPGTGVTTFANSGSLGGSGQMNAPGFVPTDYFSPDGDGVSGQPGDRAFDMTSSSGGTGPAANQALFLSGAYRSMTYSMWYNLQAPLGQNGESYLAWDANSNEEVNGNPGKLIFLDLYGGGNTDGGATLLMQAGGRNIGNLGLDNTTINSAGQWVFLSVVMDQGDVGSNTNGFVSVYAGTKTSPVSEIFTTPIGPGSATLNTANLFLGNPSSFNVPVHGMIDDVSMYLADDTGAAFSAAQVEALRESSLPVPEPASGALILAAGALAMRRRNRRAGNH
jgi:hypothetical protein